MRQLDGRPAVVTGAASGIGRAMATRFAAEGMHVVLADVEAPALDATVAVLAATGADVTGVRTDVTKADDLAALAAATVARYGAVHVLCNNAGVGGGGLIANQTLNDWRWVIDVNVWGVIHGIHHFLPHLQAHGEPAHIVNTASLAGLAGGPGMGPYCASKFAVVGLSESLHHELALAGSAVKVSVLCPGWVRTNILDSQRNRPDELREHRVRAPEARERNDAIRRIFETEALDPATVAAMVVDAVRHERFWVVTHPEMLGPIAERTAGILAGENPGTTVAI